MANANRAQTFSTSSTMLKRFILNEDPPLKRRKLSSNPNDSAIIPSRLLTPISTWTFRLVWLISDKNHSEQIWQTSSMVLFQNVINSVNYFTDLHQSVNFIKNHKDETLFLIVTHGIAEEAVYSFQNFPQINSIYLLKNDKTMTEHRFKLTKKVKGVYNDVETIYKALEQDIRLFNRNLTPINIVSHASAPLISMKSIHHSCTLNY